MLQVLASSKSKRSATSGAPSSHLSTGTGSVCLAGTFTLEPLESALSLLAKTVSLSPSLVFAPYNQVFQGLLSPSSTLRTNGGGLNVLLIRPEDWLRFWEPGQQSVSQEQFVLQNATQLVEALTPAAASGSVPYLVLFPPANESPAFCLDAREKLRSDLAKIPNVTIGDVSFTSDDLAFFDAESDAQGHIPYSPTGFAALAATITRQLYSLSNPPHKVLVLDADFTLWDGVCAEGAVHIKPEHRALQEYALQQKRAGVLLAVCSKNIEADVRRTFSTTSGMLLTEQDIVSWKIN